MKIIVTGARGFIGSHTIRELQKQEFKVYGYDIKSQKVDDIRDYDRLCSLIEPGDKILHLAAISRFADAEDWPIGEWGGEEVGGAWDTNVLGTATVAAAAKEKGAERVVYSSTGSVYMPVNPEKVPITETHPTVGKFGGGNSVYGKTKYLAELALKEFDVPYVILRYAHLYGEGKIGGAVGAFVDRMERGLKPTLFGGKQSNDFCYVKDIVQANILALFTENTNEIYNIGTGEEITTEKAFETMREVFGYKKEFARREVRDVDAARLVFDISKAEEKLGYKSEYTLEAGLEDMIEKEDDEE